MSNNEASEEQADRAAFQALEKLVGQALERLETLQQRAETAEAKSAELEELLHRFTKDEGEAGRLLTRLRDLETANADLTDRLGQGREGVDRILARIRFLENQR